MHYRGPAAITQPIPGRRRQYELEFEGKLFKRDVGMPIPQHTMLEIDPLTLDPIHQRKTKTIQEGTPPSRRQSSLMQNGNH
jgi:hypothetical protein